MNIFGGRLTVTTYDLPTGDTYTKDVQVYEIDGPRIMRGDGQIWIFFLPDLTSGHVDTQRRSDEMPDLVVDFDIEK